MTWECPNCERQYADDEMGVPPNADADEKTHCACCWRDADPEDQEVADV